MLLNFFISCQFDVDKTVLTQVIRAGCDALFATKRQTSEQHGEC